MAQRPARVIAGAVVVLLAATAGCDGTTAHDPSSEQPSSTLEHDFGVIPHGESRQHTFEITLPQRGVGLLPKGFRSSCSCGSARFVIRRDSYDHDVDSMTFKQRRLRTGDQLQLRLTLDTAREEPVDRPTVTIRGVALFEGTTESAPPLQLPVLFHYAIDAPILVRPRPHIAFGELARSQSYSQTLELHPDPGSPSIQFGPAQSADPRIQAELGMEDGVQLLHIRFTPAADSAPQTVKSIVEVATDLDNGYRLPIVVSGNITNDIVVEPFDHMSFSRFDFGRAAEHFVNVFDHDRNRSPRFEIAGVVDPSGEPWDPQYLSAELLEITGEDRATRLFLRYHGTIDPETTHAFRGTIRLTKPGGAEPHVNITFVGFHKSP